MKTTVNFQSVRPGTLSKRCTVCTHQGEVKKNGDHRCSLTGWTLSGSSLCNGFCEIESQVESQTVTE